MVPNMTPEHEQSAVLYWHRMNVARWRWATQVPAEIQEDTRIRLARVRAKLIKLAKKDKAPEFTESGLMDSEWPRNSGMYVSIPVPLLERYGLYEKAVQTWMG